MIDICDYELIKSISFLPTPTYDELKEEINQLTIDKKIQIIDEIINEHKKKGLSIPLIYCYPDKTYIIPNVAQKLKLSEACVNIVFGEYRTAIIQEEPYP